MGEIFVKLNSVEDVKAMVALSTTQPFEVYVQTPTEKVSAKSFMGMFSLDYRNPVQVTAPCKDRQWQTFAEALQKYRVEESLTL